MRRMCGTMDGVVSSIFSFLWGFSSALGVG